MSTYSSRVHSLWYIYGTDGNSNSDLAETQRSPTRRRFSFERPCPLFFHGQRVVLFCYTGSSFVVNSECDCASFVLCLFSVVLLLLGLDFWHAINNPVATCWRGIWNMVSDISHVQHGITVVASCGRSRVCETLKESPPPSSGVLLIKIIIVITLFHSMWPIVRVSSY